MNADIQVVHNAQADTGKPGLRTAAVRAGITIFIVAALAAIAIPNFMQYCAKSKKSEAKTNLKGIFTAQVTFAVKYNRYGMDFDEIGYSLGDYGAKAYGLGLGAQKIGVDSSDVIERLDELTSFLDGREGFIAYAVGNIDADPTLDVWYINEHNELINMVDDLDD